MDSMKVDAERIRQLREQRAWSQDHLASVAGISLRTVQRVETEGSASAETRLALAAALDVDVASLQWPAGDAAAPVSTSAEDTVPPGKKLLSWGQYRLLRALLVAAGLVAIDVHRHGAITWSKWPILAGLVFLGLRLVRTHWVEPRPLSERWRGRHARWTGH
jgi:transcriptional regulator with XRE-family HTH domain